MRPYVSLRVHGMITRIEPDVTCIENRGSSTGFKQIPARLLPVCGPMNQQTKRVFANLMQISEAIARCAAAVGRDRRDIKIVAVTKTFPIEAISSAVAGGHFLFGENRVQEAQSKINHFRSDPVYGSMPIEWHMIGHLQSNKARLAAELFDMVQSVDTVKLANRLNEACQSLGKRLPVLVQVDLGKEETKFGAAREEIPAIVTAIGKLEGLRIEGLMTIPPYFDDPEMARPYYAELRRLRDRLQTEQPGSLGSGHLSMGMSHDFEVAVQEGATFVRIGTAIFGERTRG